MKMVVRGVSSAIDVMVRDDVRVRTAYRDANLNLLKELGERSLAEAPEDTGELRESIEITTQGTNASATRGAVRYTADHAIYVHEIDKNYRIGKWKFLEDPWKEMLPDWDARVADDVSSALSRRGRK